MNKRLMALAAIVLPAACQDGPLTSELSESHPYQPNLQCVRAPGSSLIGTLYDNSREKRRRLGDFVSGHVGSCELALRASRSDRICLQKNWNYVAAKISDLTVIKNFGSDFDACLNYTRGFDQLTTRTGYVQFIDEKELATATKNLPQLADQKIDQAMRSEDTMWYDESSLGFVYQDSFGNPKGLRANRVGYDVGSNNSTPDIRLLVQYFKPGKFRFPFSITAGVDFKHNDHVLYFWLPPKQGGKTLPVRYWKNRSHYHWSFPVGTIFGEVLTMRAPDSGDWYTFEIRTRERQRQGWKTSIFRPFQNAGELAEAIKSERKDWQASDLKALVDHLESANVLRSHTLDTGQYDKVVADFKGAMDYLPATTDYRLIKSFLRGRVYKNVMHSHWKSEGTLTTFAASTKADFHIVPRDYIGGMFATTEAACSTCHNQTGRPLGDLDRRIILYGEVWGEDQIFTWHPFAISQDAFTVSDGSRRINPRLLKAGLIKAGKPGATEADYAILDLPYKPSYE